MGIDWEHPLRVPLDQARPRPSDNAVAADKKNYAERLSRALAEMLAEALRSRPGFRAITPTKDGKGHEASTRGDGGRKKLDLRLLNDELGLVFSASIKTYSFQDYSPKSGEVGRYQKNVVRNDMELRAEADIIHRRQPYAVMVALFFMNKGATGDGKNKHSSFAHAVFTFRKRSGRTSALDQRFDRFEKVFIGLFDPADGSDGTVLFFDVENKPPRNGLPRQILRLSDVVDVMDRLVKERNELVYEYDDGNADEMNDVDLGTLTAEAFSGIDEIAEEA